MIISNSENESIFCGELSRFSNKYSKATVDFTDYYFGFPVKSNLCGYYLKLINNLT